MKKIDERKLHYRVKEVRSKEDKTKTVWQPQYRDGETWKGCVDGKGNYVYEDYPNWARHWLFWEEGSKLYPDAGDPYKGPHYKVHVFRLDGSRIPEDYEKDQQGNDTKLDRTRSKHVLFVCDCGDIAHQFVASYDNTDPDWDKVYLEVKLNRNFSLWRRIVTAFRYVFGLAPSRFGDYDEVILSKEDIPKLEQLIDALEEPKHEQPDTSTN